MNKSTRDISEKAVKSLKLAVRDVLEKKKKLGQYAVVDRNGKPAHVSSQELSSLIELGKQ